MSKPTIPEPSPELTCDRALNMVLSSIAMEELALSRIIDAECDKMQYAIKTLMSNSCDESSIDKILSVNQSVTDMLNSVSQNQMILKNKMDKVLHGLSDICPKYNNSCSECSQCDKKCSAVFKIPSFEEKWHSGCCLPWRIDSCHGKCARSCICDDSRIELCNRVRYILSFALNIKSKHCLRCGVSVSLQLHNEENCEDIFTYNSHVLYCNNINTISMSGIIIDVHKNSKPCYLTLKLISPDNLIVEDAMLGIVEI